MEHHLPSISHTMYLWVSEFELADDISSIGCDYTQSDDEDDCTGKLSVYCHAGHEQEVVEHVRCKS